MNQLRDEYGNPVRQTDESGTMGASDTGTGRHGEGGLDSGAVGYDQTMGGTGHGAQGIGTGHGAQGIGTGRQGGSYDDTGTGALRRTGSSGSSSSEDDGQGGRRKKGMKEKIKEKLPGGHNKQQGEYGRQTGQGGHYKQDDEYGTTNTTSGIGQDAHGHQTGHEQTEKTGIMGKIKDVLPGKN